jgi:hypothetical protein
VNVIARPWIGCLAAIGMLSGNVAMAQSRQRASSPERAPSDASGDTSNDIVVVARRAGVPIWEMKTATGIVIMVGEIDEVPRSSPWRPASLEAATRAANRVILGVATKATVGDGLRLLFKGAVAMKLPDDQTADDYLDPRLAQRLHQLEDRFGVDYSRQNFLITARDLLNRQLGLGRDVTFNATEVVRKVAKQARITTRPVDTLRARAVIDDLLQAPPESHIRCLRAAMDAAEAGEASVDDRGRAWTRSDIAGLSSNPVEIALGRCWPWGSDDLGTELRRQWSVAIDEAAGASGTTLAVVPIRVLTERGGVLDHLRETGANIKGPSWDGRRR